MRVKVRSYRRKGKPVRRHSRGFTGGKSRFEAQHRNKEKWTPEQKLLFDVTSPKNPRMNFGSKINFWGTGESIEQSTRPKDARHSFKRIKSEKIPKKEKLSEEQEYLIEAYNISKKNNDTEAMDFLKKQGERFGLEMD